jgi:hypothetical protein
MPRTLPQGSRAAPSGPALGPTSTVARRGRPVRPAQAPGDYDREDLAGRSDQCGDDVGEGVHADRLTVAPRPRQSASFTYPFIS